jgi:hypothetical protein
MYTLDPTRPAHMPAVGDKLPHLGQIQPRQALPTDRHSSASSARPDRPRSGGSFRIGINPSVQAHHA